MRNLPALLELALLQHLDLTPGTGYAITTITKYLLMLIGGLAGIAAFEACSGVLMGAVLGLSSMTVSILFILPIPAALFWGMVCRTS